jgi:hypothetical protein
MKWLTRCNVKADRLACPWLIRRFIDPQAEFLIVPEAEESWHCGIYRIAWQLNF